MWWHYNFFFTFCWNIIGLQSYNKCIFFCLSPVRQKEGADVRDGRGSGSVLGQRHDVLEGDVSLCANVHDAHVLRCAAEVVSDCSRGSPVRGPAQDLDHDGVSPDGLHHSLVMFNLGEVSPIHLWEETRVTWVNDAVFQWDHFSSHCKIQPWTITEPPSYGISTHLWWWHLSSC